jgi:hypothetical protein
MLGRQFKTLGFQRCTFLCFALFFLLPFSIQAFDDQLTASQNEASERVFKLNRHAMQLLDNSEYVPAEKALLDALSEAKKAGLKTTPAMLNTHGNLGVLYSVGIKDKRKAIAHFREALAIKPDLKLNKQRLAPETETNFNLARLEFESGGKDPEPQPVHKSKPTAPLIPFKCPTGGDVRPGEEVTLKCLTSGNFRPNEIQLFYKVGGQEDYQSLSMTKNPSGDVVTWVGKIPGSNHAAGSISFYFEARNSHGTSLGRVGRPESPSLISIRTSSDSKSASNDDQDDVDREEEDEIDDDNPLARLEKERYREQFGSKGTFWVSLGVGSGVGYASAHHTEAYGRGGRSAEFNAGIAFATLGHLVPEIGYFLGRNTAITLTGRNQYMQYSNRKIATGANSVMLRLLFLSEPDGNWRYYVALAGGGGEGFRFRVKTSIIPVDNTPGGTVADSVRGGPYVAGGGTGLYYRLNRHWLLTLDTQVLVGMPNFSSVLDVSSGMRYEF